MSDAPAADEVALVAPHRVSALVHGLIAAAVAPGSVWTYEALSCATGLKVRRLKSYVHEGKEPSLSAALSLAVVLGKPQVNAVLSLIGYGGASPLDEADALQPMVLTATAMSHLSIIATAAADGRIDHLEAPACREAADMIIATVLPLSSAGGAA